MKYLDEYRNADIAKSYLDKIHRLISRPWSVMEICGGQTHSLVKNGILELLPEKLTMVHGPGCPVCVTPMEMIDKAIAIADQEDCILCSFGDMLRVPGSVKSLLSAKANGADVRTVYSPMDAVMLAISNPDKNIVFFAVGFETTAPANGLSVLQASRLGLKNYFILSSHVLVPPAMEALLLDEETKIDGFLAAGHVCTVMGTQQYIPITGKFNIPVVVTGFEPVDMLQGLYHCVLQLEEGRACVENEYARVVNDTGNLHAQKIISEVFEVVDRAWRGIGILPGSGLDLNEKYRDYDANLKFTTKMEFVQSANGCIAGLILKGIKKPVECGHFGKLCTPQNPLGAPMVSSEGACAAYYNYSS
jgi:hydrogenase expression/formation protein HypD